MEVLQNSIQMLCPLTVGQLGEERILSPVETKNSHQASLRRWAHYLQQECDIHIGE